jgi:hypothetical protein
VGKKKKPDEASPCISFAFPLSFRKDAMASQVNPVDLSLPAIAYCPLFPIKRACTRAPEVRNLIKAIGPLSRFHKRPNIASSTNWRENRRRQNATFATGGWDVMGTRHSNKVRRNDTRVSRLRGQDLAKNEFQPSFIYFRKKGNRKQTLLVLVGVSRALP